MKVPEFIRLQVQGWDRRRLLYYLAVAAFAFCLENAPEWLGVSPETQNAWAGPGRVFGQLYQWQATLGPRKPRSHFVRLVVLRPATEPDELVEKSNRCPQREFLSRLLPAIAAVSPALIAIDKTFSPNLKCPETDELLAGAAEAAKSVPVVVSATTVSAREAKTESDEFRTTLERKKAVAKLPALIFPPGIRYAISTLDIDDRRIPLKWPVYPNRQSVGNRQPVTCEFETESKRQHVPPCLEPSLALMAATLFDPGIETLPAIINLEKHRQFAFTNFLRENEIGSYSAIDLLCNAPGSRNSNWRACRADAGNNSSLQKLRNRVVVIGEQDPGDIWDSPVGEVPGVVLHANYIEALLDDRYLQPAPAWLQILSGFFVVAALDLIIEIFDIPRTMRQHWTRTKNALVRLPLFLAGVIVAFVLLAIASFVLVDVAVVQFGYLPLIVAPGLLGVVLKLGERVASINEA